MKSLQVNLTRLIAYAESADVHLQREVGFDILARKNDVILSCSYYVQVAEKLANEAVKPQRQAQIVEYGGLQLLVPLTNSKDIEVQRLAAHALANLSVNGDLHHVRTPCLNDDIALLIYSGQSIAYGEGRRN